MTSQKPKPEKKPAELTTDEAVAFLFPDAVVERAKHEVQEADARVRKSKGKITK